MVSMVNEVRLSVGQENGEAAIAQIGACQTGIVSGAGTCTSVRVPALTRYRVSESTTMLPAGGSMSVRVVSVSRAMVM